MTPHAHDHFNPAAEHHFAFRAGWLRAAVLGANDGLISTASLMVGVAAASSGNLSAIVTAGIAGVAAGAMSMAAGEYVSVKAQSDIEEADRRLEAANLLEDPEGELAELAAIYRSRGLSPELASQVAIALTEKDALGTHLRDELGMMEETAANPLQAALASAAAFTLGGLVPFLAILVPESARVAGVVAVTLVGLTLAGVLSARASGMPVVGPTLRVVLGGSLAMAITTAVGLIFKGLIPA